jgi:alpha-tubulin suppressor-like RCC1 family protein
VLGGYTFTAITGSGSVSGTFCAQTDSGIIYCWGDNNGNKYSSSGNNSIPSASLFSGVDIRSLTLGEQHACGIAANGTGYCWGNNVLGSLGVTSPSSSTTPIALSLGAQPSLIVAGGIHSCAILADGTMKCWGQNYEGALGNGTTSGKASPPAPILEDKQFSTISSGRQKTCGLDATGKAYCWGEGWEIDNMGGVRAVPSPVPAALTFASISAENGQHACAVRTNGEAWCWGATWEGQLGSGSSGSQSIQKVATSQSLSRVSTGNSHTCALSTANTVLCWGRGADGQIGDGANAQRLTPTVVTGFTFTSVTSGVDYSCALTADGVAYCWGRNGNGQLGDGTTQNRNRPTAVLTTLRFSAINAGREHTCGIAVAPAGRVYCWGASWDGRLGNGVNSGNFTTPSAVASTLTFSSVDAGASHTCAITTAGETYCWGSNRDKRLGYPEALLPNGYAQIPVRVSNDPGFTEITASGDRFTCGRTAAKVTHCWGSNANAVLTAMAEAPASVSSGGTRFKTTR